MDEQRMIARLWARFSEDHPDLANVDEIVGAQAKAILDEKLADGIDPMAYIEESTDAFLEETARRTRDRASELGIRSIRQSFDHERQYQETILAEQGIPYDAERRKRLREGR